VFELRGRRHFVYSAYIGDHRDLIIAPMQNPWRLSDRQIDIAWPTHDWEMQGGRKILEAPEFLEGPGGKVFLTYSASACWSDDDALGLLTARPDSELTDAGSWRKSPGPAFAKSAKNGVYAPGHDAFFTSPDGKQNWLIYHAHVGANGKCTSRRAPRIQPFHWRADGTSDFGEPVRDATPLPAPAG
jgi:GH43 family beta-xylosidase